MAGEAEVWIDDGTGAGNYVDITDLCVEGSSTHRLNRPAVAQVKVPMAHADPDWQPGSLLKIYFDGWLHHHGRVLLVETDAAEDTGYTVFNSTDPLEMWAWRPVQDADNDYSDPSIVKDNITGPAIVEAMIQNSEVWFGSLFVEQGAFAGGGVDLTGAPTDWPMTMAQLASLLISTGELDVICTPIELTLGGNYGQIDAYNGDYGQDLQSSVVFEYGLGDHNVRAVRWNRDMTNMANYLRYLLGPRMDEHHWRDGSIQGSDPSNPNWAGCGLDPTEVINLQGRSVLKYGQRVDIQVFDARGTEANMASCLFRKQWLEEATLRAVPRDILHITPIRGEDFGSFVLGDFDIGDIVYVDIHSDVHGGISGGQRIYEYTVSWDTDSVLEVSELQTSADIDPAGALQ